MSEPGNRLKDQIDSQAPFAEEGKAPDSGGSARFEQMPPDMPDELSELLSGSQAGAGPSQQADLIMNSDRFEIGNLGQDSLGGFIPLRSTEGPSPNDAAVDSARFLQEQAELAALFEGEKPPSFGAQIKGFSARFAHLMLANRGRPIRALCAALLIGSASWWAFDQKDQIISTIEVQFGTLVAALDKDPVAQLDLPVNAGGFLAASGESSIHLSDEESELLAALLSKVYGQEQADQDWDTQENASDLIEKGSQSSAVLLARFAKELGKPVDQRSDAMKMLVYWLEVEDSEQSEGTWRSVQNVASKPETAKSSINDQAKPNQVAQNQPASGPDKAILEHPPRAQKVAKGEEAVKAPASQKAPLPLPEKAKPSASNPSAELALQGPAPKASSVSKVNAVESAGAKVAQAPQVASVSPPSIESSGHDSNLEPSAPVSNDTLANSDQSTWSGLFGGFSALWPWSESTEQTADSADSASTPDSKSDVVADQSSDQKDSAPANQGNQGNQAPLPSLAQAPQAPSPNPVDLSAGDARLVSSVSRQVNETRKTELANTQGLRQACFALQTDDVSQIQIADKLFPQVSKLVVGSSFVSERKEVVASYFVALSKDLSRDQATRVRLKEHRLDSYMISEEGQNKGRLSLGVFAEKEFARNFAADLKLKGFDVEVLARKNRVLMSYQINVPWESREGVQRALSKRLGPDFSDHPCEVNSDLMARLSS